MEQVLIAGNSRFAFAHHPSTSTRQCQALMKPKHDKFRCPWRKQTLCPGIVLAASSAKISSDEDLSAVNDETISDEMDDSDTKMLSTEELNKLLIDAERIRLVKKLSEANQYNRFMKRQLQSKDDDLIVLKTDLAVLEEELQDLVGLAEEIANLEIPPGTRQIRGEYIQFNLLSRLKDVHLMIQRQIEGVDLIKSQEVTLSWIGMAESVQVMGSFDGWSQGEDMSPEYDGGFNKFSVTLKLRPGRYEVKFLVDGNWQLSPELPTIGDGFTKNNLLVV